MNKREENQFTCKANVKSTDLLYLDTEAMRSLIKKDEEIKSYTDEIRKAISEGDNELVKSIKINKLPTIFPCVWKDPNNEEHVEATGLVQFDIDNITIEQSEVIKTDLTQNCPYLYYAFISPKGGLKYAIKTDFFDNTNKQSSRTHKFKIAYELTETKIKNSINSLSGVELDSSCGSISQQCFLAHDPELYLFEKCEVLKLNNSVNENYEAKRNKQTEECEKIKHEAVPEEIERALSHIPMGLGYKERLTINFAVLDGLGQIGISLLLNHWAVDNRSKLTQDLNAQFEAIQKQKTNKIRVATLFHEALKYGYKPKYKGRNNIARKEGKEPFYNEVKISLTESKQKLSKIIDSFFIKKENTIAIVEAGLGKTQMVRERILKEFDQKKRIKVAYFVPDHKLGDEVIKKHQEHSTWPFSAITPFRSIKGFNKKCDVLEQINSSEESGDFGKENGFMFSQKICDACGINKYNDGLCSYHNQFSQRMSGVRLYSKEYLFHRSSLDFDWKPDFIIIDEDIVNHAIKTSFVQRTELVGNILEKALIEGFDKSLIYFESQIRKSISTEIKKNNSKKYLVDKMTNYKRFVQNSIYKQDLRHLLGWIKYLKKKSITINAEQGELSNIIPDHKVDILTHKTSGNQISRIRIRSLKSIDEKWTGAPILYMDATGVKPIIEKATGIFFDEKNSHRIKTKYNENVEIQMISNNTVSKKWMSSETNRQQLEQFLKLIDNGKTGYTTYKNLKAQDYSERLIRSVIESGNGEDKVLWYGNLRGSNLFEDNKWNQQVQIGRHALPSPELAKNHQLIFDIEKPINHKEQQRVDVTIRMKDGNHLTIEKYCYNHPELQAIDEHFNKGESCQAGHRLRLLHGQERKRLLILTNEILDFEYTRVWDASSLFFKVNGPRSKIIKAIKQNRIIDAKKNKILIEKTGCSDREIINVKSTQNSKKERWTENNPFFDQTKIQTNKTEMTFFTAWDIERSELEEILHTVHGVKLVGIIDCSNSWQLDYLSRS